MATLRRLYPGGHTSLGFFSYFDQILPFAQARRIYALKGGPGVGKSTFMRKMGEHLSARGENVELFPCASDPDSLDGLLAPGLGLLFVDGTAPHIVDPRWPGAVDGIINLGDCLDERALTTHKAAIGALSLDIAASYARAYRYLGAAERLREDSAALLLAHADPGGFNAAADALIHEFLPNAAAQRPGRARRMFASAITARGCACALGSQPARDIVALGGPWTTPTDLILSRLMDEALRRGFDAEGYCCALNPRRLEHVYLPAVETLFITVNPYHGQDLPARRQVDLNAHISVPTAGEQDILVRNEDLFLSLLRAATDALGASKSLHDALEEYYVRHMDYARADAIFEQTLTRIEPLFST